jgi:hypothetical protein
VGTSGAYPSSDLYSSTINKQHKFPVIRDYPGILFKHGSLIFWNEEIYGNTHRLYIGALLACLSVLS